MKRSVRDLAPEELRGRRALVRVDYNVPLQEGRVADATRIEASCPTLRYLLERDARPVLLSHLGRPGGRPDPHHSLAPVADELERKIGARVHFVAPADSREAVEASRAMGGDAVLLLENVRFLPGEAGNDDALAARLASLGELYVNDAFGCLHRAHASTVGVARLLRPAVTGLRVEEELRVLGALLSSPARPFVAALGGAKIADKISLLRSLLERCDRVLVGGVMANTLLRASGLSLGASRVEQQALPVASELLGPGGERLLLPTDLVLADDLEAESPEILERPVGQVPDGYAALDIGEQSRLAYGREIREARTFFWNGPMGRFENPPFAAGTFAVARAAVEATQRGAFTVVGGGDSARALREAEAADRVSFVSTGGGASLEFLAGKTLPGLAVLESGRLTEKGRTSEGGERGGGRGLLTALDEGRRS
ncbi:MAG: phosphoglycerate kinase [Gemmatimonadota bacterium]